MTFELSNINLFLLVFMRMSGALLLNPIFGRNNIPALLRGALSLVCAMLITPTLVSLTVPVNSFVQLTGYCVAELIIGLGMGFAVNCLFSVVIVAGEQIDWQMGFSMANIYDPAQGASLPVIGNFMNALMFIVFFAGNAHLALLKLIADSFRAIPPGTVLPGKESFAFLVKMGGDLFEMALRMALPFIAVELIIQISLGILIRAVPQMNIFAIGIQLEALAGILMLLMMMPVMVSLCDRLSGYLIEKCAEFFRLLVPA